MPADVLASKLFQVSGARKRAASHKFITSLFLDHSQTQAYAGQDSRRAGLHSPGAGEVL